MLIYFAVVAFPLMVGSIYNEAIRNRRRIEGDEVQYGKTLNFWVFVSALPMFVLIALRHHSLGADTYVYQIHFLKTINTPWDRFADITEMEEGFTAFVKLITYVTEDPLIYQCICTAIYYVCIVSFVNQLETDRFLVLFLFGTLSMYTFMFTAIRQCLAISLCLYSYKYIKKQSIIPFIILIFLATLIHKSSFLFAVSYFIYNVKLSSKNILIYIFSTGFAVAFLEIVQGWFNEQMDYEYGIESGAGGFIFSAAVLGMTIFALIFAFQTGESKSHFTGIVNVGIIAAVFWVLRIFTRVAERPSFYFLPFVFAAVAYALESLKDERERAIMKYIVMALALGLFYYRLSNNAGGLIPYQIYDF